MPMWRVVACARPLLRDPTSELFAEVNGWGAPAAILHLAAVDLLHGANWQRGGGKGVRPRPFARQLREAAETARAQADIETAQDPNSEVAQRLRYLAQFDPAMSAPAAELDHQADELEGADR